METIALAPWLQGFVLAVSGSVGLYVITGVIKKVLPFFQRQDEGRKARITALAGFLSLGLVVLKNFVDGEVDPVGIQNWLVNGLEVLGLWLGATATHLAAKPTVAIGEDVKVVEEAGSAHKAVKVTKKH